MVDDLTDTIKVCFHQLKIQADTLGLYGTAAPNAPHVPHLHFGIGDTIIFYFGIDFVQKFRKCPGCLFPEPFQIFRPQSHGIRLECGHINDVIGTLNLPQTLGDMEGIGFP